MYEYDLCALWTNPAVGWIESACGFVCSLIVYVCVLTKVFWTNGINIYAGVNGLETGQTVIISAAILVHNFIQLPEASHLLSIYLTLPFFSAAMGLTFFNW